MSAVISLEKPVVGNNISSAKQHRCGQGVLRAGAGTGGQGPGSVPVVPGPRLAGLAEPPAALDTHFWGLPASSQRWMCNGAAQTPRQEVVVDARRAASRPYKHLGIAANTQLPPASLPLVVSILFVPLLVD